MPIASTTASKLTGQFLTIKSTFDPACSSTRTHPSCDCIFACLCTRGAHHYNDKRYVPSGSIHNHLLSLSYTRMRTLTHKHIVPVTVSACEKWCASDKREWKTKCSWSKRCGGCSECKREWLLFVVQYKHRRIYTAMR